MADWRDCFTSLGAWTITGITLLDVNEIPNVLPSADLPLMFPTFTIKDRQEGRATPVGFTANQLEARLDFTHTCFMIPVAKGIGPSQWYPNALDLLDAYQVKLAADPDLGGNLSQKMLIKGTHIGEVQWRGVPYVGFEVKLHWVRQL